MPTKAVHSPEYKVILKKLKETRLRSGLKQNDVAKRLGLPQSYVSKVESGERRLDVIELKKLAEIYKKPVSFFIGKS